MPISDQTAISRLDELLDRSGELVDSSLQAAEQLLEQPVPRTLAVNTLCVILICLVALLFYYIRRTRVWAPIGTGLQSLVLLSLGCLFLFFIDVVYQPPYAVRSVCKVTLFFTCILVYQLTNREVSLRAMFRPPKGRELTVMLVLGFLVFCFLLGGYFVVRLFIDFSAIPTLLAKRQEVTRGNFVLVALYISLFNSLLEEIFFRGFAYLNLRQSVPSRYAAIISALAFSLYHLALMSGWFSLWVTLAALVGLFLAGLMFNILDTRSGTIYRSWVVHMCANFAINTVGLILFGTQ